MPPPSIEIVKCSFCNKSQDEVIKLISGPSVYICNECIELCQDILNENDPDKVVPSLRISIFEKCEIGQLPAIDFLAQRELGPSTSVYRLIVEYDKAVVENAEAKVKEQAERLETRRKALREEISQKQSVAIQATSEVKRLQEELASLGE